MIGARVKIAVVSLGAEGAVACVDGRAVEVAGFDVGPSIDTTGAGDLFVAAWAWGDASGLGVDDALRWAALYAALSVRVPTGAGGATHLERVPRGGRPPRPPDPAARAASGSPDRRARGVVALRPTAVGVRAARVASRRVVRPRARRRCGGPLAAARDARRRRRRRPRARAATPPRRGPRSASR